MADTNVRKIAGDADQRGLWVAVFGPDGAGKSTVIQGLTDELSLSFCGIRQFHFRPQFRRHWVDSPPVTDPHGMPARGTILSLFKLLYWLADCWYGYLFIVRPARAHARLVISDRYFHDIVVDPYRYRLPVGCLWFARFLGSLAPRPDLFVLLDAPAGVVLGRKPELSYSELWRQRLAYIETFCTRPNAFIVDGDRPVGEVTRQVSRLVLEGLAKHNPCAYEVSQLARL